MSRPTAPTKDFRWIQPPADARAMKIHAEDAVTIFEDAQKPITTSETVLRAGESHTLLNRPKPDKVPTTLGLLGYAPRCADTLREKREISEPYDPWNSAAPSRRRPVLNSESSTPSRRSTCIEDADDRHGAPQKLDVNAHTLLVMDTLTKGSKRPTWILSAVNKTSTLRHIRPQKSIRSEQTQAVHSFLCKRGRALKSFFGKFPDTLQKLSALSKLKQFTRSYANEEEPEVVFRSCSRIHFRSPQL
ncbi:hypothetical protein CAEBREN_06938 [Caenorhabditis brenneri]|uniref:Uncharacterized protein n=1 Tax=Caenorhabditis brenneri TaxID=135651 RepID=G0PKG9_CAEBE|nr:hypothetical protein CAEBREN_06938 [Caenorhabditis brenneri]